MKIAHFVNIGILELFLVLIAGCSWIEDPLSSGEALWELHGSIANPGHDLKPAKVRAVLVWDYIAPYSLSEKEYSKAPGEAPRFVQDVPINPEFPAKFTIKMNELPPEELIGDNTYCADDKCVSCRTANAKLVIYEDKNSNGKLDFLPFDADDTVDRVIGPQEWYDIVYLDAEKECDMSDFLRSKDIKYRPGFNVVQSGRVYKQGTTILDGPATSLNNVDWMCVGEPSSTGKNPVCEVTIEYETRLLAKDESLELTLKDDLYHQFFLCLAKCDKNGGCYEYGRPTEDWKYLGVVPIDQVPANSEFFCYDDGYTLAFKSLVETEYQEGGKLCGLRIEKYVYGKSSITADASVPTGWPCEIKD